MKISAPRRESRSEGVSRIICGAGPASSRQRGAGPDDGPDRQPECVDKTMEVGFAVSAQGHRDAPRSGPLSKSNKQRFWASVETRAQPAVNYARLCIRNVQDNELRQRFGFDARAVRAV